MLVPFKINLWLNLAYTLLIALSIIYYDTLYPLKNKIESVFLAFRKDLKSSCYSKPNKNLKLKLLIEIDIALMFNAETLSPLVTVEVVSREHWFVPIQTTI